MGEGDEMGSSFFNRVLGQKSDGKYECICMNAEISTESCGLFRYNLSSRLLFSYS
jgi:hypothetical protein